MMIIECAGHRLIWIQGIHSYAVSEKMVKLALKIYDCFGVVSSAIVHATWIEKDTVACGGHFLTPQVMDSLVDVLGQPEFHPGAVISRALTFSAYWRVGEFHKRTSVLYIGRHDRSTPSSFCT